jgi:hypothetical protein
LSHNHTHITCGIHIVDPCAINPLSSLPIGIQGSRAVQCCNLCHPFQIVHAKDSSNLYEKCSKTYLNFFKKVTAEGFHGYGADQFCASSPQDNLLQWKCLKRVVLVSIKKAFVLGVHVKVGSVNYHMYRSVQSAYSKKTPSAATGK